MANTLYRIIANQMPNLKHQLRQADMPYEPEAFAKRSVLSAFMLSVGVCLLFLRGIFVSRGIPQIYAVMAFPVVFIVLLFYMLRTPATMIKKKEYDINKEIVFATRFLIIEIESGVPHYDAFVNLSKAYPVIGKYFRSIVDSVNMGSSMEEALAEIIEISPSRNLRRVLWQISNTISTGADASKPLNAVLNQIVKDQKIEFEEYGRKLNPMAMFYMIIAVIMPSLGTTLLLIFSTFTGFKLDLMMLLTIAGMVGFIQFMFYGFIKSSRPAVDM